MPQIKRDDCLTNYESRCAQPFRVFVSYPSRSKTLSFGSRSRTGAIAEARRLAKKAAQKRVSHERCARVYPNYFNASAQNNVIQRISVVNADGITILSIPIQ